MGPAVLVSHETNRYGNDKPTLRFTARAVRVTADGTIRNFTDTSGGEPLADLAITAQLDHIAADPHPTAGAPSTASPTTWTCAAPRP
jgi:hypothetical protein